MFGFNKPALDTVVIEFLKNDLPYMRGETAGFPRHQAEMLIAKGFARLAGDGRPQAVGGRIPEEEGSGVMTPPGVVAPAAR